MKKSAMTLAFQTLRRKPMVLLLLLPVPVISALVSAISLYTMPDMSKMLDMDYLMNYAGGMETTQNMMITNMISMLVSSISMILSLCSLFLLVPAAMELLADGAAGRETAPGWFTRGMRRHWWKPIADGAITDGIYSIIAIPLAVILYVVLIIVIAGTAIGAVSSYSGDYLPTDPMDFMKSFFSPAVLGLVVLFVLVLCIVLWVIRSVFGLFLPALADRSFGEAFKLLFSKKGFRKLPRMLGGQALILFVPGFLSILLYLAYLLINGMPTDAFGFFTGYMGFLKSWAGILSLLLVSILGILVYPFRFAVHQLIRDEEANTIIQMKE